MDLAFPDGERPPPKSQQRSVRSFIARHVCRELGIPELDSGRWYRRQPAALVSMPEASMNEYGAPVPWKDEIRTARQRPIIRLEPQTGTMQVTADQHLGLRVPPTNPPHHRGALLRADDVDHGNSSFPPVPSNQGRGLDQLDGLLHADGWQVGQVDRVSQRHHA